VVLGDLNFDYLHAEKGNALKNVCDIFDLTNLIKNPTCFCKDANPCKAQDILPLPFSLKVHIYHKLV
jgi:hypothetical protein